MKAVSLSELKKELGRLGKSELTELCIRLAKHKKENKELLTYLLFESADEFTFISTLKDEMDQLFSEINKSNLYFAKKSLRKILRIIHKHIKFSGSLQTEAELLIYFCNKMKKSGISFQKHKVLLNLYQRTLDKIEKAIASLHEDLQYDLQSEADELKL
jgi:hypothetical protein